MHILNSILNIMHHVSIILGVTKGRNYVVIFIYGIVMEYDFKIEKRFF